MERETWLKIQRKAESREEIIPNSQADREVTVILLLTELIDQIYKLRRQFIDIEIEEDQNED